MQPTLYAMGGGGGAGKSTILRVLQDNGAVEKEGAVLVNADAIKELIPEYEAIVGAGDGRAADIVHKESSDITTLLMDRLIPPDGSPRHNIIFDGTLANGPYSRREMERWKNAGLRVHLIGVTIDPQEAMTRALLRALKEKRWVPAGILMGAHNGFNSELKSYLPLVDAAHIYDNTGKEYQAIATKASADAPISIVHKKYWDIIDKRSK